jgi:hypothetical protein
MSRLRKKKGLKVRRCVETPLVPRAGSSRRVVSRRPCRREARTTSAPRKTETPDVGYGEIDRKTVDVSLTRAGNRARSVRASAVRVSHRVHALDFALGQPELRLLGAGAHDARGTTGLPDGDLERRGVSNSWHRVSCGWMWSECRSAKHAPGHLATVGLAQRPLEPEAGRRGDGKRHCRFCVHARATRMRVLRARACGIDARDDKVSRRRSGRLSMNRSHFRTVAMKRENIGFKTKKPRFGFRNTR